MSERTSDTGVDDDSDTDGGSEVFTAGDVVHDRDDDDPNTAIVVNLPPVRALEWEVRPLGKTLAEDNPDYPEDAWAVIVVFREELAEYLDVSDSAGEIDSQIALSDLADEHVQFYAFPEPRLEPTGERYSRGSTGPDSAGEREDDSTAVSANSATADPADTGSTADSDDGTAAIDALEQRLSDSGMRVVDRDGAGTLTVKKMRDTYRVEPGRVLEGDGRFRQRLEQLVRSPDPS